MLDLDDQLMERFQGGDADAFTRLFRRHQAWLINYIFGFVKDRDNAEDLAQETFIRVDKAADTYQPGRASFKAWLRTIAKRLSLNHIRDRKRRDRHMVDNFVSTGSGDGDADVFDLIENAPADPSYQPEVALEREESSEILWNAILAMPEKHRTLIILRDMEGRSYEEISEILGLSLGTTKSRINRARHKLKDKLKPFFS